LQAVCKQFASSLQAVCKQFASNLQAVSKQFSNLITTDRQTNKRTDRQLLDC